MARIDDLLKAIAVTAELTGTVISESGAKMFADDLRKFAIEDVLDGLSRCRRELRSKLTVAAVVERIEYSLEQRQTSKGPRNYDCAYESDGMRCKFPGAHSHGLHGGGPWYCRVHYRENGTRFAEQTLAQSQSYRAEPQLGAGTDLLNDDLKDLEWLNENLPMLPGETRPAYNERCRNEALSMMKGYGFKSMDAVIEPPVRIREPGEDLVEI